MKKPTPSTKVKERSASLPALAGWQASRSRQARGGLVYCELSFFPPRAAVRKSFSSIGQGKTIVELRSLAICSLR